MLRKATSTLLLLSLLSAVMAPFASLCKIIKKKPAARNTTTLIAKGSANVTFPTSDNNRVHISPALSKEISLQRTLSSHFSAELGISSQGPNFFSTKNNPAQFSRTSVPATMQYYLLPQYSSKVNVFFGIGPQFNEQSGPQFNPAMSPESANGNAAGPVKTITILFTQGVTYQISTKINVVESIHVIPANNNRTLGIDLGIGYKLP